CVSCSNGDYYAMDYW
nr:immunoglobulin heavy chain junction region [Mus musculus]